MRARGKFQIHRGQDRTGLRGEHKMEATAGQRKIREGEMERLGGSARARESELGQDRRAGLSFWLQRRGF